MASKVKIDKTPTYEMDYSQEDNYKFEFTLLEGDKYLVSPFECKDYLQDIFWSEYNKKSGSQYGLKWVPGRLEITNTFRLAISGGKVSLKGRASQLKKLLNAFEKALGFKLSRVVETDDEKLIVVIFSKEWTTCAPLISSLTSIIRIGGAYAGGDVIDYLNEVDDMDAPAYMEKEVERLETTLPRMLALLEGKKPDYPWNKISTMGGAHACGIVGFSQFPEVDN